MAGVPTSVTTSSVAEPLRLVALAGVLGSSTSSSLAFDPLRPLGLGLAWSSESSLLLTEVLRVLTDLGGSVSDVSLVTEPLRVRVGFAAEEE